MHEKKKALKEGAKIQVTADACDLDCLPVPLRSARRPLPLHPLQAAYEKAKKEVQDEYEKAVAAAKAKAMQVGAVRRSGDPFYGSLGTIYTDCMYSPLPRRWPKRPRGNSQRRRPRRRTPSRTAQTRGCGCSAPETAWQTQPWPERRSRRSWPRCGGAAAPLLLSARAATAPAAACLLLACCPLPAPACSCKASRGWLSRLGVRSSRASSHRRPPCRRRSRARRPRLDEGRAGEALQGQKA